MTDRGRRRNRRIRTDQDGEQDPGPIGGRLDVPVLIHRPDVGGDVDRVNSALKEGLGGQGVKGLFEIIFTQAGRQAGKAMQGNREES